MIVVYDLPPFHISHSLTSFLTNNNIFPDFKKEEIELREVVRHLFPEEKIDFNGRKEAGLRSEKGTIITLHSAPQKSIMLCRVAASLISVNL